MTTDDESIRRGELTKPRLYVGKHDREFDLYDLPTGQVAAATIGVLG